MSDQGEHLAHVRQLKQLSAGILLYREDRPLRVLLAHPGGPYFGKKDAGAWTIPKGLVNPGEDIAAAARREFEEELGWRPEGELAPLGEVTLRSGKRVVAFAMRSNETEESTLAKFSPGRFSMEWPPRSGRQVEFPEVDRIELFAIETAKQMINDRQLPFLDRLVALRGK
jgi:predicted NUDIX family NTP pyrophosphohydrolase